jgi:Carbohydrate/starch-binding module (family 21)
MAREHAGWRWIRGWKPWPVIATTVIIGACAMSADGPSEDPDAGLASAPVTAATWGGGPVQLVSAQVASVTQGQSYPIPVLHSVTKGVVWADPAVDPVAVTVHYKITRNGHELVHDWDTADATVAVGDLWEFETDWYLMDCPHYCARIVFQFALEMQTADGTIHWDNNGGPYLDYVLASDMNSAVPVYHGPVGILAEPVQLSWARWIDGLFEGRVLLENLAHDKDVTIVYSTDGWQTVQTAQATWGWMSLDPELETWRFQIPMPAPGDEVLFAVRYDVDGQTFWDNNLGRDYRLVTPAGVETSIPEV